MLALLRNSADSAKRIQAMVETLCKLPLLPVKKSLSNNLGRTCKNLKYSEPWNP